MSFYATLCSIRLQFALGLAIGAVTWLILVEFGIVERRSSNSHIHIMEQRETDQ